MIPLTNYDCSEGEQWGRYNLPRYVKSSTFYKPLQPPGRNQKKSRKVMPLGLWHIEEIVKIRPVITLG